MLSDRFGAFEAIAGGVAIRRRVDREVTGDGSDCFGAFEALANSSIKLARGAGGGVGEGCSNRCSGYWRSPTTYAQKHE
jgi:hypothetical protein